MSEQIAIYNPQAGAGLPIGATGKPLTEFLESSTTLFATAAQGAKADTALQPTGSGAALTGITAAQVGAKAAPAVLNWSTGATLTVTATDRDTDIILKRSIDNGDNLSFPTGAAEGITVRLWGQQAEACCINGNHWNLTGSGQTFKAGGSNTTVNKFNGDWASGTRRGESLHVFISRGGNVWSCFYVGRPIDDTTGAQTWLPDRGSFGT